MTHARERFSDRSDVAPESPEHIASVQRLDFTADNVAPVAPEVLAVLAAVNEGYAAPYGADIVSERVSDALASFVNRSPSDGVTVGFALGSGVAANALALAAMTAPGGKIFCHEHAHIRVSEHGAPEHQSGCKLIPIDDDGQGTITPAALELAIDRHLDSAGGAISLTNLTEAGTAYRPAEIAELARVAKQNGLAVHVDGARLANAAVALSGEEPTVARDALASLTWRAGVHAVSIGLTKNGGMSADAVVFFEPSIAERFPALRDRAGHRPSKMRFLSAQVLAVLENEDWVRRAMHANRMANLLATELSIKLRDVTIVRPVEGNQVFARLGARSQARLARGSFRPYAWPRFGKDVVRLVTNWTTTAAQIERLMGVLAEDYEG